MIEAEVIKAVQQFIESRGIKQLPDETLGDFVARGLGISAAQADSFLTEINSGVPIEDAEKKSEALLNQAPCSTSSP